MTTKIMTSLLAQSSKTSKWRFLNYPVKVHILIYNEHLKLKVYKIEHAKFQKVNN